MNTQKVLIITTSLDVLENVPTKYSAHITSKRPEYLLWL